MSDVENISLSLKRLRNRVENLESALAAANEKLRICVEALNEIITHVGVHPDGLDGRFVETKSTVRALKALDDIKQIGE